MELALALLLALPAQDSRTHVDERAGFKLRPPKEWSSLPVDAGGERLAKFVAPRAYFWTGKGGGWTREHTPELTVLAFEAAAGAQATPSAYERYMAHLDRALAGRGYTVEKSQTAELDGVPVRKLELALPDLQSDAPGVIVAWVFDCEDIDFALQCELFVEAREKLGNELESALATFRRIPRVAAQPESANAPATTPYERRLERQTRERSLHERALATLPKGWRSKRTERLLVLDHDCDRAAARMAESAEALLAWLDANFAYVGAEEYVPSAILRVCKDRDEAAALERGAGSSYETLEIVTHDPRDDWNVFFGGFGFHAKTLEHWFRHRDAYAYVSLPAWLSAGLRGFADDARIEKGKLVFKRRESAEHVAPGADRDAKPMTPRELLTPAGADFAPLASWTVQRESIAFLHFLFSPAANKSKRAKELLPAYFAALRAELDLRPLPPPKPKDAPAPAPEPPLSPEEAKKRMEEAAEKQRAFLQTVFDRAFAPWTDADWKELEKLYFKWLD